MGFLDSMKGANMNFGTVDSPDFNACYLAMKDDHFMITGAQAGTYEFKKEDLKEFIVIASGAQWIKYKLVFKDGKKAILTSVINLQNQGSGAHMATIERYFGDLL